MEGWVGLRGWLQTEVTGLQRVAHPSTNRAGRWVTSLTVVENGLMRGELHEDDLWLCWWMMVVRAGSSRRVEGEKSRMTHCDWRSVVIGAECCECVSSGPVQYGRTHFCVVRRTGLAFGALIWLRSAGKVSGGAARVVFGLHGWSSRYDMLLLSIVFRRNRWPTWIDRDCAC